MRPKTAEDNLFYRIRQLPDRFFHDYQIESGGDVCSAVYEYFRYLLRSVASLPSETVSTTIRFSYSSKARDLNIQNRLDLWLIVQNKNPGKSMVLSKIIENSPVWKYFDLERVNHAKVTWSKITASCDVVRREDVFEPLFTSEFNDRIRGPYYVVHSFSPKDKNDFLLLDNILGSLDESVIVDISLEPIDISRVLHHHTRYLAYLESINRTWDADDKDDGAEHPRVENEKGISFRRSQSVKPLRYKDPFADDIQRRQRRFHEKLCQPHLRFHIRTFSENPETAHLLGSVVAESSFADGEYRLFDSTFKDSYFKRFLQAGRDCYVEPFQTHSHVLPQECLELYSHLACLGHIAPSEELLGAFRLPVASFMSPNCIRKNTDPPGENKNDMIVLGVDETPFDARNSHIAIINEGSVSRGITFKNFPKHLFISGVPGCGKTTAVMNIMLQLHENRIPFLVIEPAKTEYRILKSLKRHKIQDAKNLARDLQVYTPGDESCSPFRLNPLALLPGIFEDEHIDNLMNCFLSTMPVFPSLPALLGESLEQVYKNIGGSISDHPCMADLVVASDQVMITKNYSADTHSDLSTALETRLGILVRRTIGKVFQCRESIPNISSLLNSSTIVELDRLPPEQACLISLFLLTMIREFIKTTPKTAMPLRFVIILEEAHNIVGRSTDAAPSESFSDPKAFASSYICRMLAELRALGIGIIIADQLPSAVAPEVIKNTSAKLSFRQVAKDDREELGGAMLLDNSDIEDIARLQPGQAYFYKEGFYEPRRIKTRNLYEELNLGSKSLGMDLSALIAGERWFKFATQMRIASGHYETLLGFERKARNVYSKSQKLQGNSCSMKTEDFYNRTIGLRIIERAQSFIEKMTKLFDEFESKTHADFINTEKNASPFSEVLDLRHRYSGRYDELLKRVKAPCLEVLQNTKSLFIGITNPNSNAPVSE